MVPVLCSSVPLQPSPNKRAQAPADSIEFPMGSKETLARNWSFHFSQVNYISLFIFVVDRDLSRNSCLTHATTVLSDHLKQSRDCNSKTCCMLIPRSLQREYDLQGLIQSTTLGFTVFSPLRLHGLFTPEPPAFAYTRAPSQDQPHPNKSQPENPAMKGLVIIILQSPERIAEGCIRRPVLF